MSSDQTPRTPDDWQVCESMHHTGDDPQDRDPTVEWRELGLMCDVCARALIDCRDLLSDRVVARAAEALADAEANDCFSLEAEVPDQAGYKALNRASFLAAAYRVLEAAAAALKEGNE